MRKKIFLSYVLVVIITILFAVGLSWNRINSYLFDRVAQETVSKSDLMRELLIESEVDENYDFQAFVDRFSPTPENRITIIDSDGVVIADSEKKASQMENHKDREEVAAALSGESKSSLRYSDSVRLYYYYYAIPLELPGFSGVLRVSIPIEEIEALTVDMLWIIILGILVGAVIALGISFAITRVITKPIIELRDVATRIAEGNYDEKIYISQRDQIGQLAEAFNSMTFNLRMNMWKLSQKNAELESILTSMSNGLVAVDENYHIVLYNQRFIEMLDLPESDLNGKLFYEVTRELTLFEMVEQSMKEKESLTQETSVTSHGEMRLLKIAANPIYSIEHTRKVTGTLLMLTDVTKIRKLEHMRRDFVSNVTHELKTPLTSIKGFVDTLKNGAISEEKVALRFLDIIDIEAERLSTLIQDILVLSEIENLVADNKTLPCNMEDVVLEVKEILSQEIEEKNLNFILEVASPIPDYLCNRDRMKQLFINLIDNAVKYTDRGQVKVKLKEAYRYLYIEIQDTGIGIEYQHLSRIFERFYRVDKGRSRKMGGTGLGLSICKHIVELYSGSISIESEVGIGTKILIKLPY